MVMKLDSLTSDYYSAGDRYIGESNTPLCSPSNAFIIPKKPLYEH